MKKAQLLIDAFDVAARNLSLIASEDVLRREYLTVEYEKAKSELINYIKSILALL